MNKDRARYRGVAERLAACPLSRNAAGLAVTH
jgi:hypothetical protein